MADSASLRARRSRAHKAGDHSLCRPERCPEAETQVPEGADPIEAALRRYLVGLDLPEGDVRAVIAATALRLAEGLDRHATASAARELRGSVAELQELGDDDGGRAQGTRMLDDLKEMLR